MNDQLTRAIKALKSALIIAIQNDFDVIEKAIKDDGQELPEWVSEAHDKLLRFYATILD